MNKKEYIIPQITVVNVSTSQLMAGSLYTNTTPDVIPGTNRSRRHSIWDDEDEEDF